jgi:hypothetical protein
MRSDFFNGDQYGVKICNKCLDDSNDADFWENHQELPDNKIWCTNKGQ